VSKKHFFTASTNEADFLRRTQPSAVYEGIAFNVYQWDPNPGFEGEELAVYRFYNSDLNRHFWTANDSEIVLMNASDSWNNEGVVFYGEKLGN
jgi:hypothetical protein